ncbi:MAG: bifunctional diaminohydroxyphosphoribosylaminopyrimidine deaminase/5-amino-6-(5-phosphoribosylamino)uracil reductase RibD [Pseudomonadota bacterium]
MRPSDEQFMDLALRMGRRNLGATAENPSVGCIIVKEGLIVGRGVTAPGGRPHAETQALAQAGPDAAGATAYVTLEPCAHYGRTPPCCDALIAATIGRVVIAVGDPDPRTRGKGTDKMRAAGIVVDEGVCEAEGRAELAGYLSRMERGRPWVTLKMAVSADGMMAEQPGVQTVITQEAALRRSQIMRSQTDAILVGAGTVRCDDPSLTCRLPGLEARSPVRIVLGGSAADLKGTKLAKTACEVPVWWMGTGEASGALEAIACELEDTGRVNLPSALHELGARGIGHLIVEGGAQVAASFLQAGLVDCAVVFTAPHKLGPDGVRAPLELLAENGFGASAPILLGVDQLTVYDRAHEK